MGETGGGICSVVVDTIATQANFDGPGYVDANPDVRDAIAVGTVPNALWHFTHYGHAERRPMRLSHDVERLRRTKLRKIERILRSELSCRRRGTKYDFLTAELAAETGIADTHNVSSNGYDGYGQDLIAAYPDGLILDCGAGKRPIYYGNVVNYEIVDYDTTDVIGVGEHLPFVDDAFDAVISIAVLEHVRDPFACAAEITRVLKPGGKLLCCVPFLQPQHGYPHHYFNMAPQGLRSLFDRTLVIDDHKVVASILPIWSLFWMVQSWASGLRGSARAEFGTLTMDDLLTTQNPVDFLQRSWVRELPEDKNFELASATLLFAHKAERGKRPRKTRGVSTAPALPAQA